MVTSEQITAAALELGVATITMTSVAQRLGVNHATLYRYVTGRDDLVRNAIDRAVILTEFPQPRDDWQSFLRDTANALFDMCDTYPGVATELAGGTYSPMILQRGATLMACLARMDFGPTDAVLALDLVTGLVIDHCRRAEQMDGRVPSTSMPSRSELASSWPRGEPENTDSMQETLEAGQQAIAQGPRDWFDRKLRIALAGIAAELAPH
ncbi:TetR/AcrR family transcriptional regulator C-terminal domain-containing protein [Hoyosella sp. G463]|uniref:TetR/AcrR family transcriptional regulator C-terminal domain-containing protein n=1 Tax=Lolliginicoccus lacisalsi TaxID=2742202 RepID=A0A927PMM7_9ACTN|nr:TetR/AcrR family transcriptional regulator C-terminal domain-containing protein [Lolliginicoccus lacisalsi]MBD8507034.1 TetR/AcrR family transcriptional regulator C-terminal domain-containing protein [Lolliginicoccus lacisalsi]